MGCGASSPANNLDQPLAAPLSPSSASTHAANGTASRGSPAAHAVTPAVTATHPSVVPVSTGATAGEPSRETLAEPVVVVSESANSVQQVALPAATVVATLGTASGGAGSGQNETRPPADVADPGLVVVIQESTHEEAAQLAAGSTSLGPSPVQPSGSPSATGISFQPEAGAAPMTHADDHYDCERQLASGTEDAVPAIATGAAPAPLPPVSGVPEALLSLAAPPIPYSEAPAVPPLPQGADSECVQDVTTAGGASAVPLEEHTAASLPVLPDSPGLYTPVPQAAAAESVATAAAAALAVKDALASDGVAVSASPSSSLVVPAAAPEAPQPPPSPALPPLELRVVTFNLRFGTADDGPHSWHLRRDAAAAAVRRQRPDVVALQEALKWQYDELLALLGAPYVGVFAGRDDGGERGEACAVLFDSGRLACSAAPATFWLSDTPAQAGSVSAAWGNPLPRIATRARFRHVPTGRHFSVVNTHLDYASAPARVRGMRLILSRHVEAEADATVGGGGPKEAEEEPWLLCGDLNDGPDAECVRAAGAAGALVHTLAAAAPAELDRPTSHGFAGEAAAGGRDRHIDYIFASSSRLEVLGAGVDRSADPLPSDHFPVWASCRWS